jgi:hypothetical protein
MHTVGGSSARRPAAALHHAIRHRPHAPLAPHAAHSSRCFAPRPRARTLVCCFVAVPALVWLVYHVFTRASSHGASTDPDRFDTAAAPPPIPLGHLEEPTVVDAVFTYVNGSDPVWRASFDAYLASHPQARHGHPVGADVPYFNRYRDWNELRYSMRSLHMHAPWIRHVYLVLSGPSQIPRWLDAAHARVRIVYHRDLFPRPELELPTFNSLAIESVLHRIDGLSNHFLYLNNDVFFGRRARVADFIDARAYRRFIDWTLDSSKHDPCFAAPAQHGRPACARIQYYRDRLRALQTFRVFVGYWFAHTPVRLFG